MNDSQAPNLIKVTEIFLVPSSFLVAALGTADSNPHRAAVSLLGVIVSILWCTGTHEAFLELVASDIDADKGASRRRVRAMFWLPIVFLVGWLLSLLGHLILWNQPLGH